MMKNIPLLLLLPLLCTFASCSDGETYAEQKEKERTAITSFLKRDVCILQDNGDTLCDIGTITEISEEQFILQDSTTDLTRNEYVRFNNSGVYMQIVRKGLGEKLENRQTARIICRFIEYNIMGDSVQLRSDTNLFSPAPDIIKISNYQGTFTATLDIENSLPGPLYQRYQSTSVPKGWLIPFSYIKIGRQGSSEDYDYNKDGSIAKVRLIVPHSEGQSEASSNVYPCFYELTFQKTRD